MNYVNLDNNFFGRDNVLSLLKRRLVDLKDGYRQNIALLGNQFVGKSTVLLNFITNLDDQDIIFVYLDLENKDFNYFYHKFIGSLLYNYSKAKKLPVYDDLNLLIESTSKFIPYTIEVIKKIQLESVKGKVEDAFLGLLTLPEVFTNETEKFCVLILDEFQNLEELLSPDAFQILGKKIMTQTRCFYLVSSSFPVVARKILSEKLSLLFGNFEILELDHFSQEESCHFIESNLGDLKIGMQLRNFLADFTGGHPLYLNLICQEIINLSAIFKQNEIYMPLLSQAVENTIFSRWGVLSRHFELIIQDLCSTKQNTMVASILISLSNNKNKIQDIANATDIKKAQVSQRLNKLIDQGIVVRNGNFHYFKDKLFKYWIKFIYQKRIKDVELIPDKQKKLFKEDFNRLIDWFNSTTRKDFTTRIVELLHCFDNEAFKLNGRNYRLPFFREVTPMNLKNENIFYFDGVKAVSTDSEWFIIMKKDNFNENDINLIVNECKKNEKRPEKCLMISLAGIEENAKLRALQEKFWIWDQKELNTLLTLFDKPFITR